MDKVPLEERIYSIRLIGRNIKKDKGISYDVYGVTIPFPAFFGKKCRVRVVDDKNVMVTTLNEAELSNIEEQKKQQGIKRLQKKHYQDMLNKQLITQEQFDRYVNEGIQIEVK